MSVELTDDMREAFANAVKDGAPVLVASASASGMPDLAYKGSAMVWDKDHIAFWERARGQTMRNLEENGQVCLLYRNVQTRVGWKFFGRAEVLQSGELREEIMAKTVSFELDRDPERKGAAVLIRIDRVLQAGQVLMERED
jgi:predicted pyridoxine 5'-phosphate oxidase superfamily flavin-nucleotide-binding protein